MRFLTNLLNFKNLKSINLIVLDVDGVLTDGGLLVGPNGEIYKKFNVKDGLAIKLLQKYNMEVAFLSGGDNRSTEARATQLGIKYCLTNIKDKRFALKKLQKKLNISINNTLFLGDDLNDLVLKPYVKILASTKDANPIMKKYSNFHLQSLGGKGAVRELTEIILKSKGLVKDLEKGFIQTNN